jgi:hypothetical protein
MRERVCQTAYFKTYPPKCVEGEFRELRVDGVLRSSVLFGPRKDHREVRSVAPKQGPRRHARTHDRGQHHHPAELVHAPGQRFYPLPLSVDLPILQYGLVGVDAPYADLPFQIPRGGVADRAHYHVVASLDLRVG